MPENERSITFMIFDLDGTLVRSGNDIASAVNHALERLSLPQIETGQILKFIGDGVQVLIEKSLGPENIHRLPDAMSLFTAYYDDHMLDTTDLFEDVHEVLSHFSRQIKVIVTNKRCAPARAMVEALRIAPYFESIIGSDSTPYRKPDPRVLDPLKRTYRIDPRSTLIIGDGMNDVLLARNAGLPSCAILNGLGDREELLSLKPDHACERLRDMIDLFT